MSSIEFIGFLFMVALVTFVSILRRRLRGADQEWTATDEVEDAEKVGASVDATKPTTNVPSRPTDLHTGILGALVKRKLTELVDGLQPTPEELGGGFPTTSSHVKTRPVELAVPLPPPAPPMVSDGPNQETATIEAPPAGTAESVRHALRDGDSIRRAMIMKELLDRPVAMRDSAIGRRLRR